jgi:hypothetical protein
MLITLIWLILLVLLTFSAPRASIINFTLLCLGLPAKGADYEAYLAARSPLPSPSPNPIPPPASGRPVRDSRVNMSHFADLALEPDVKRVGLLPFSFAQEVVCGLLILETAEYHHSWFHDSQFCTSWGKGFFFRVPPSHTLPVGSLIGVYTGRDTKNLHLFYPQA